MITIQASVSKGWLNKFGGFKFDREYYFDPLHRFEIDNEINVFVKEKFPGYPIYNMEDNLVQAEFVSPKQILVGGLQPNLILGSLLGCTTVFYDDKDSDISGKPLENIERSGELPSLNSLIANPLIQKFTGQILDLRSKHPDYKIIPPFFWDLSGRATIHGIITTSLKLAGENIFMLMITDPSLVHSIHRWITDAYIILINYFSKLCSLPVTSIHIGECSCTMLSQQYFLEFAAPYINRLGEEYRNIRLHSCGKSDGLIDAFSKIPALGSLDLGSGTSIKSIREKFGNKIDISTFPPPDILVKGSELIEVQTWLDNLIKENLEGNLRISYHIEPGYELQNCLAINKHLESHYNIKQIRLY